MEGSPYFTNILDIAFELYVLVTTANSPDVMYVSHQFTSTDICSITESTFLKTTVREKNSDFLFIHICCKIVVVVVVKFLYSFFFFLPHHEACRVLVLPPGLPYSQE